MRAILEFAWSSGCRRDELYSSACTYPTATPNRSRQYIWSIFRSTKLWFVLFSLLACFSEVAAASIAAGLRFERRPVLDRDEIGVLSMLQDRYGFIWVGTPMSGIYRYDGAQARHFGTEAGMQPHASVTALYEAPNGVLWAGTQQGLFRYDAETEAFISYRPPQVRSPSSLNVRSIIGDGKGGMWIATWGGLQHFDSETGRFREYMHDKSNPTSIASNDVNALAIDAQGGLYAGTWPGGLEYLPHGANQFRHLRVDQENAPNAKTNIVRALHVVGSVLWIGTEQGLLRWEMQKPWEARVLLNVPLVRYTALYGDTDGTIWAGTLSAGVQRWLSDGTRTEEFLYRPNDPYSLPSNYIRAVFRDRAGLLWIGTYANGIRVANLNASGIARILPFDRECGQTSNTVQTLERAGKGKLWLGNNRGVTLFNPANGQVERCFNVSSTASDRLSSDVVYKIYVDPTEVLWIGTASGLHRLDGSRSNIRVYHFGELRRDFINTIAPSSSGKLWVGTGGDVVRFDPGDGSFEVFAHSQDDPSSRSVTGTSVILEDRRGRVWMGSEHHGGGLDQFDSIAKTFKHFRPEQGSETALPSDAVTALHEDRNGRIWVGTGSGLAELITSDEGVVSFRVRLFSTSVGTAKILAITSDSASKIWISTVGGLLRIDPDTGLAQSFGPSDGLSGAYATGAVLAVEGNLYFSGYKGITKVWPECAGRILRAPQVALTHVRIGQESIVQSIYANGSQLMGPPVHPRSLIVAAGAKTVSFGFAALHDLDPDRNSFKFALDGLDNEWVNTQPGQRTVSYTNLDPGEYRFRIRAWQPDSGWSDELTFPVTVLPQFWQTSWFRIVAMLVLLLLLAVLYQWRVRHLRKLSATLRKKVAERTAALEKSNAKLAELSNTDMLTGIGNRRAFESSLESEMRRARRTGKEIALILFDIDHFKSFNDTYGHQAGDGALNVFGQMLAQYAQRPGDLAARYGGEEFALLLPEATEDFALNLAEQICVHLQEKGVAHSSSPHKVMTVSAGAAVLVPTDAQSCSASLIALADRALYKAKHFGRNRAVLASSSLDGEASMPKMDRQTTA